MAPTVAVIGAGPLGLMALKNFKEDGFDVTCFEARDYVGGLWKYSTDGFLSVAEDTRFNNSRYRSAFSDFPFSNEVDDFPTWQQMYQYQQDYADHFGLRPHLQLNSQVTNLSREGDKWAIEIAGTETSKHRKHYFDKVAVSVGSFYTPKQPKFDGTELFEGSQTHAMLFHGSPEIKGKRVLLVGGHASAVDVCTTLRNHGASHVYVSHKNGIVFIPRYGPDGAPYDLALTLMMLRAQLWISSFAPNVFTWLMDKMIANMSAKAFPNKPKSITSLTLPSLGVTPPLIADEMYDHIQAGFVDTVPAVKRIVGPRTVEIVDGQILEDIDMIIYSTGYHTAVPFVEKEHNPYPVAGQSPELYRNIFPLHPDPAVRNSLAFLGHGTIPYPGFVMWEMQSAAVSQIWLGNSKLASYEEMRAWSKGHLKWRHDMMARQPIKSTFFTQIMPFGDYWNWMEDTSGFDITSHFGWGWKAWKFWWSDRQFYNKCQYGMFSPAMYRLFESGKRKTWPKAREQILIDQEIAVAATKRNKERIDKEEKQKTK